MNLHKRREFLALFVIFYSVFMILQTTVLNRQFLLETELREAEVALSIYNSESFENIVAPYPNRDRIPTKPPVFHWLVCTIATLVGTLNEFVVRFASVLYMGGSAFLLFFIMEFLFSSKAGFYAAIIFLTTLVPIEYAILARVDSALLFFVLLALWGFLNGHFGKKNNTFYYSIFVLALSVCTMAKGPFGTAIPIVAILPFLFFEKCIEEQRSFTVHIRKIFSLKAIKYLLKKIFRIKTLIYFVLFITPIAIWLWISYVSYGVEFFKQAWNESIARLAPNSNLYTKDFHRPLYWYVPTLLKGFMPWSFFGIAALIGIIMKTIKLSRETLFFVSWFVAVFLMFSLANYKRGVYILPTYPAFAGLTALLLVKAKENKIGFKLASFFTILVFLVSAIALIYSGNIIQSVKMLLKDKHQLVIERFLTQMPDFFIMAVFVGALIVIFVAFLFHYMNKLKVTKYFIIQTLALLLLIVCTSFAIKIIQYKPNSVKDFSLNVNTAISNTQKLYFYPGLRDFGVLFYTNRRIPQLTHQIIKKEKTKGGVIYAIVSKEQLNEFLKFNPQCKTPIIAGNGTKDPLFVYKLEF